MQTTALNVICPRLDCDEPLMVIHSLPQPLGYFYDDEVDDQAHIIVGDPGRDGWMVTCDAGHDVHHSYLDRGENPSPQLLREWLQLAGVEFKATP